MAEAASAVVGRGNCHSYCAHIDPGSRPERERERSGGMACWLTQRHDITLNTDQLSLDCMRLIDVE